MDTLSCYTLCGFDQVAYLLCVCFLWYKYRSVKTILSILLHILSVMSYFYTTAVVKRLQPMPWPPCAMNGTVPQVHVTYIIFFCSVSSLFHSIRVRKNGSTLVYIQQGNVSTSTHWAALVKCKEELMKKLFSLHSPWKLCTLKWQIQARAHKISLDSFLPTCSLG